MPSLAQRFATGGSARRARILAAAALVVCAAARPAAAAVCDDHDVVGPFTATAENPGKCKQVLLDQVDCVELCAAGECAQHNPFFANRCLNVSKQFTNLLWFKESRTCTVDAVHCRCRCADPAPGRGRPGACGDGVLDPGEECDPGSTAPATAPQLGGPGDGTCPVGGTCNADCTCGDAPPPVCGDGILDPGEECDPPGTGSCPDGGLCTSACTCALSPLCGNGTLDPGERCDPPGIFCGTGCIPGGGCFTLSCSGTCQCTCGNTLLDPGEDCDSSTATCPFSDDVCLDCLCVAP